MHISEGIIAEEKGEGLRTRIFQSLIYLFITSQVLAPESRLLEKIYITFILDVFSLFHRLFLNNTELKIFGRHWESNP